MLPEEARAVVGEWCGGVPARLARVAAPPASRTAAPLRALVAKSVISTFPRVLPRLRRISAMRSLPASIFRRAVCRILAYTLNVTPQQFKRNADSHLELGAHRL
jgi:hypothetical protein